MSIDATELRRLHARASANSTCVDYSIEDAWSEMVEYLGNHVPDILAALEDRDRLDSGRIRLQGQLYLEQDLRSAIDAARGAR